MTGEGSTVPKIHLEFGPCEGEVFEESPRNDKFLRWLSIFKLYTEKNDIKVSVFLTGSYLDNPSKAVDIDIVLTHANYDDTDHEYKLKIRDMMLYGMGEALKMKMFVDMAFYIPFDNEGSFWYSSEEFNKTRKRIESRSLRVHDRFFVEGESVQNFHYKEFANYCKELDENLFEVGISVPDKKHVKRIKNGELYSEPKLLFRRD